MAATSAHADTNVNDVQSDMRAQPVSPFTDRNFFLLWLGQLISSLGDSALLIAIPVTIYTSTHSKLNLSSWAASTAVSSLVFGLFAGAFVDRWNRRRTMIGTDLLRAAAVLLMLFAGRPDRIWVFYPTCFLVGAFSCFFTPARMALMAALLPRERLIRANAVSTSGMQIVQLIGPVIGAGIWTSLHLRGVLLFDSATFLISAFCVMQVTDQAAASVSRVVRSVWEDARAGFSYVIVKPVVSGLFILLTIVVLGSGIYNTLEYAFASDLWHVTPRVFGLLMAVYGVGGVLAGIAAHEWLHEVKPDRLITCAFGIMTVAGVAFALARSTEVGAVTLFFLGFGNMLANIPVVTLFQSSVANEMLGRVVSMSTVLMRAAALVAAALAAGLSGIVAREQGHAADKALRMIFVGLSAAFLACALLSQPLLNRKAPAPTEPG